MHHQKIVVSSSGFEFEFNQDEIDAIEILNNKDENFTLLHEQTLVCGEIISASNKLYDVEIDGEQFSVQIKTHLEQVLDTMGLNNPKTTKIKAIKAPMPGLVIEINVKEGQAVIENEKILILEAMKMENVIKIPHDAVIKRINVINGQAVEKGQILIELE